MLTSYPCFIVSEWMKNGDSKLNRLPRIILHLCMTFAWVNDLLAKILSILHNVTRQSHKQAETSRQPAVTHFSFSRSAGTSKAAPTQIPYASCLKFARFNPLFSIYHVSKRNWRHCKYWLSSGSQWESGILNLWIDLDSSHEPCKIGCRFLQNKSGYILNLQSGLQTELQDSCTVLITGWNPVAQLYTM